MAAPVVITPKNSFITWREIDKPIEQSSCCDDGIFCLPWIKPSDIRFQFRIQTATQAEAIALAQTDGTEAQLVLLKGTGNNVATWAANLVRNFWTGDTLTFERTITGEREVTFYWNSDLSINLYISCEQCFELAVIMKDPEAPDNTRPQYVSHCFKRSCEDCYSSVVEFACDDDSYDFRYCQFDNGAPNRIRLPFYLFKPQTKTEKSIYVRSDGSSQVTKSVSMQEWEALVDYVPKQIHFALALALEHDQVLIDCETADFNGGFRCNNDYSIDWTEESDCVAQAKFKGNTSPYNARNTNCQTCADCPEIVDFELDNFVYQSGPDKLSFTFTYSITGPVPSFVILEYKLSADSTWSQSVQANISPINILLDPGVYDFRMIPQANNCLPDYTTAIENQGDDNPVDCEAVQGLQINDITTTGATAQWSAVLPTPSQLYDWVLFLGDGVTVVNSGDGYWNPGTLILGITGLTPDTDYIFQVVSHCDGDSTSAIASIPFTTLP